MPTGNSPQSTPFHNSHNPLLSSFPKPLNMFPKNKLLKKLKSIKGFWRSSKVSTLPSCRCDSSLKSKGGFDIEWEVRPGGMLVQKRRAVSYDQESDMITLKVSTGSSCHDIYIQATSTFGELKSRLSVVTSVEAMEQRLLYKGKERDDNEHLHMVGVSNNDKILLFQDPATKEIKKLDQFHPMPHIRSLSSHH